MDPERWKQVAGLLEAALDLPSAGRDEFLRKKCEGDVELECEVRSLLASHRNAGGFLERPAVLVAPQAVTETQGNSPVMLGRTISH